MTMNPGRDGKGKGKGEDKGKVLQFRRNDTGTSECFWSQVDAEKLRLAVDAATRRGAAIILGLTSDGGAYSLCVLDTSGKAKEYPHGKASCEEVLDGITEYYTS